MVLLSRIGNEDNIFLPFAYLNLVCLFLEYQKLPGDSNLPMVIGIVVGVSAVLVIATLLIIEFVNRRFYSRQIKLNAHYVGSVMSEHITSTLWRPTEQRIDICDVDISTDNSIYMLADSRRYENM